MRLRVLLAGLAALVLAAPAAAVTVGLSEMSSDFGELIEPTDPADIPANITIEVGEFDGGSAGDELKITIDNTLSTYDVSEFWLNHSDDITSVTLLSFPNLDGGWNQQGSSNVDGFGTFDFGATVDGGGAGVGLTVDLVENGSSEMFIFDFGCAVAATCTEEDFNENNASGKSVSLKFRNGFNTVDGDSAWGASSSTSPPAGMPEPGTLLLGGIGLLLVARLRRR